jgi:hypothetical protein
MKLDLKKIADAISRIHVAIMDSDEKSHPRLQRALAQLAAAQYEVEMVMRKKAEPTEERL